jgi:DNA repair protein RadC
MPIAYMKLSQGGLKGTVVDIKMIIKVAIDLLAQGIVLCHNHPSGNLMPSKEDKKFTRQIKEASALFEIEIIDHIILTKDSYFSFLENSIMSVL